MRIEPDPCFTYGNNKKQSDFGSPNSNETTNQAMGITLLMYLHISNFYLS